MIKRITDTNEMTLYLSDESRRTGTADEICFPESAGEIQQLVKADPCSKITIQGARTGVTAGAVPGSGTVINLSSMDRILDLPDPSRDHESFSENNSLAAGSPHNAGVQLTASVQPGVLLCRFNEQLKARHLMFMPDPTETTASLGGMVSCNSSGARSYRHSATRNHILGLEMVLADGDTLSIKRGEHYAKAGRFSLVTGSGRTISGMLPDITMPDVRKHTAGYYIRPDMDLIDLFIGSEGTLGIVTKIDVAVYPVPAECWGTAIFFDAEDQTINFVSLLRSNSALQPEAVEFFGTDTLSMLRAAQAAGSVLTDMPAIPDGCAVYTEFTADSKASLEGLCAALGNVIRTAGGDPAHSWFAFSGPDMQRLKDFRHAAPVCVNEKISEIRKRTPGITKLGTDMSVPDECLGEVFRMYRSDLRREGFETSLFGHIGNNHLHCNIIPHDEEEYRRGKDLYAHWADEVVRLGGSVSAEHGIGKLKPWLLQKQYSPAQLRSMLELKKLFDPYLRLNPGNIFG